MNNLLENRFYVYVFKSNKTKKLVVEGADVEFKKGDIYYIGKGNESRIKYMTRNIECNYLTDELEGTLEIVAENLSEEDALALEDRMIAEHREIIHLANKLNGQKNKLRKDNIPYIKFLIELDRQGVIEMSYYDLERETNTSRSSFYNIQDSEEYISAIASPPENLLEILKMYTPSKNTDEKILGEMKYVLELIDNNLLKMTYKDLYSVEYNTYHEKIKEAKEFPYAVKPSEEYLEYLIKEYGFHIRTEKDLLYGKILSCLNLKNMYNLKVSDSIIADLFNVNLTTVTDIKRRQRKNITPVDLDPEIIGMLMSTEKTYLFPDTLTPKNKKFEWEKGSALSVSGSEDTVTIVN